MHNVTLPLGLGFRLAGPMLILIADLILLACPIVWSARLLLAAALTLLGIAQWLAFLRRRPVVIEAIPAHGIVCRLADGTRLPVGKLRIGALGPWLVSARLEGVGGGHALLFVPGPGLGLGARRHRQLRRMLVDFSSADARAAAIDRPSGG